MLDNSISWLYGGRRLRGALILGMGCVALVVPFFSGQMALFVVGVLIVICGVLEILEFFVQTGESGPRSTYLSGVLSVFAGILLLNAPQLVLGGLSLLFGGSFLLDGVNKIIAYSRNRTAGTWWGWSLGVGFAHLGLGLVLVTKWPVAGPRVVAILVGLRMLGVGWPMVLGRVGQALATQRQQGCHPDHRLGLPPHAEFTRLEEYLQHEDAGRRSIDAYWCWIFILLFFAIHVGRMRVDWNLVGMISPLVAVLGDLGTALLLTFGLMLPCRLAWRRLTRRLERRGWVNLLQGIDSARNLGPLGRLSRRWLLTRLRFSRRVAIARYSPEAAVRWGMQVGLPATAILIAVNPMWGLNWVFNSESWAVGAWNRWAEVRTDTWREKMIEAVEKQYPNLPAKRLFQVDPPGVSDSADFSFLILGDTGEGGSAQHALRDQYLFLGQRPDVKFLVISSDVIYPSGAMLDYEPKFHLPFKGFTKPIYAIPGNHDWYDALEAFAANFLEPNAARACMLARIETDKRLTSTTEKHIENYIQEAGRLRNEYGLSTGSQRGPFFEVQTDRFALLAVDTGVLRTMDSRQWDWLQAALERARGKFILAILGHPLYAGGRYQGGLEAAGEWAGPVQVEPFAAIHRLLKEHQVQVVMAGDTHYFEHYLEKYQAGEATRTMLHFVNGGGGAYISIGTPLDWPKKPAVPDCAFFPSTQAVTDKLDRDTPAWKMPLWLWAKHLGAWPVTAETIAGAFDYSRAPFFQSFVEVRVEGSANRVRLIPHDANGPLRWRQLQTFGSVRPAGKTLDDQVEWVVAMPAP